MIGSMIGGILSIFISLIDVYIWVIIISALLSFVNPDPYNPVVQFLYRVTEPVYALVRRIMPTVLNGLDFAPLIVIIALQILEVVLKSLAMGMMH